LYDSDAYEFLEAAQITDTVARTGINNFVKTLKDNDLWNKMSGIYPFIGDTSYANKFNLKDPRDLDVAFRLDFEGAGTIHSSNSGVNFAGSDDYAKVFFNPNVNLTGLPVHLSFLSLEDVAANTIDLGCEDVSSNRLSISIEYGSTNEAYFDSYSYSNGRVAISSPDSKAFFTASRITPASGFMLLFNNSTTPTKSKRNIGDITSASTKPNFDIYLGAINQYGAPFYESVSNRKFGFFSVGDGLTSGQCVSLYSAVKQLQVDLNRNLSVF
jgi:hypothetical protein